MPTVEEEDEVACQRGKEGSSKGISGGQKKAEAGLWGANRKTILLILYSLGGKVL